jgi:hypothetical protein
MLPIRLDKLIHKINKPVGGSPSAWDYRPAQWR